MGMTTTVTISDSNISGMTFTPGVIQLSNTGGITISGTFPNNKIILDGQGEYIFQVTNGDLITDSTNAEVLVNLIDDARESAVYWLINGSVNLQTLNGNIIQFLGTIITQGNIDLGTGSINYGTLAAPNTGGSITLNTNIVRYQSQQLFGETAMRDSINLFTNLYINLESDLSDNQAIKINAYNANGGINMNAGFGGIAIDSTNSINMNAEAASSFAASNGNLLLQAKTGLINIDGVSGVNIGNNSTYVTPEIDIGTQTSTKRITVGNLTDGTFINMNAGTGGINVNTGTGGAISLNANGSGSNFSLASNALLGNYNNKFVLMSQGTG